MAQILGFISIALACTLFQLTLADTFSCTDEPAVCKTKFGTQFEKAYKNIHIPAMRNLFNTYINEVNSVKADLPPDHEFIEALDESVKTVQKSLQKMNDNLDDSKKIAEAIKEGMRGFDFDLRYAPKEDEVKKTMKHHDVGEKIIDILRKLGARTGNIWAEMYLGLRETDLKAYPEYEEVNKFMENLRGHGTKPASASDFTQAAYILAEKFGLEYFENNPDIS